MRSGESKKKLDAMDRLNEFWGSSAYIQLDDVLGSRRYVELSQSDIEITDKMLQHLHDRILVCKGLRINVYHDVGFDDWKAWFEQKFWPLLKEKARKLAGLYYFYMEMAIYSDAVIMFDYDAWTGNLAMACLLAYGITHDIYGNPILVRMDDPMLVYIKENASLAFMRYRSEKAQEEIIRLKNCTPDRKLRVGVFGGGAEPALFLNDMDLDGIEVIIYDVNAAMKGVLEQIMEQPLEELGIDYRVENMMNAYADESLFGTFDLIIYNGVMSYYPEKKKDIALGTQRLLREEGVMFFDDILMHPDMAFARFVRGWTVQLVPEKSLESAVAKNEQILPEAGLAYEKYEWQDVRDIHNVVVNWAVKRSVA